MPTTLPSPSADRGPGRQPGQRARHRQELVTEILATARHRLASDGAAALSLRAVARDIGIAPSALYRYFPSRDNLLTVLIAETYAEIGTVLDLAVTQALADHAADPVQAWADATMAYRSWARSKPSDFALVYGSPVPGYVAPDADTRDIGRRAGQPLFRILTSAMHAGRFDVVRAADRGRTMSTVMREGLVAAARRQGVEVSEELAAGIMEFAYLAWAQVQGLLVVDVFGHLPPTNGFADEMFRRASVRIIEADVLPARPDRRPQT